MSIFVRAGVGEDNLARAKNKLHQSSWRGVKFLTDSVKTIGGQKTVVHEYPNSDVRTIESLGKFEKGYEVQAIISGAGYFELKRRLTSVLEMPGEGVFVHPFDGEVKCFLEGTYDLEETDRKLGECIVTFKLLVAGERKNPTAELTSITKIKKLCDACNDSLAEGFPTGFNNESWYPENVQKIIGKADDFGKFVDDKKAVFKQATDKISDVQREIDNFVADTARLINLPAQFGVAIVDLYQSVKTLYTTPRDRLDAMFQFFGFGDDDPENPPSNTVSRAQINGSINTVNSTANAAVLSEVYRSAAEIEYQSVDEIEAVQDALEAEYKKIFKDVNLNDFSDTSLDIDTIRAFEELRSEMQIFLNREKLTAPRLVSVYVDMVPAQVLSYQYYGESRYASDIVALNDLTEPSFVEGETDLVTV